MPKFVRHLSHHRRGNDHVTSVTVTRDGKPYLSIPEIVQHDMTPGEGAAFEAAMSPVAHATHETAAAYASGLWDLLSHAHDVAESAVSDHEDRA